LFGVGVYAFDFGVDPVGGEEHFEGEVGVVVLATAGEATLFEEPGGGIAPPLAPAHLLGWVPDLGSEVEVEGA